MIALGFAWLLSTLEAANAPLPYTVALVAGGLWGSVFLHIGVSFPTGRLSDPSARRLAIAGYFVFPLAGVPALLFAGPHDLGCDDCPTNLLLVHRDADAAAVRDGLRRAALPRALRHRAGVGGAAMAGHARRIARLQLTPVYVFSLLTFLLVTVARAGAGDAALWPAFISTLLMPFAFLGGLLRSRLVTLDAELRASLQELRASRARIVEAGDAERRRLERDLHDGAQSRLVALKLLLSSARTARRAATTSSRCSTDAIDELDTSLSELRELARGIHPAVLTDHGLEPALQALASNGRRCR